MKLLGLLLVKKTALKVKTEQLKRQSDAEVEQIKLRAHRSSASANRSIHRINSLLHAS